MQSDKTTIKTLSFTQKSQNRQEESKTDAETNKTSIQKAIAQKPSESENTDRPEL